MQPKLKLSTLSVLSQNYELVFEKNNAIILNEIVWEIPLLDQNMQNIVFWSITKETPRPTKISVSFVSFWGLQTSPPAVLALRAAV